MYWGVMGGQMRWGMIEDEGWRKGPWTAEEDRLLIEYVRVHGEGRWNSVARLAGLKRNGKSCRLRWVNYLRPDLKRGQITPHEESIILDLHARWGNRWSTIARSLPGRTDNEIKNYWRTHFKKKQTKASSVDTSEKAKARLLKRRLFHQEQQQLLQLQQQQQQQQQYELNQIDLKRILALLEDTDQQERPTLQPPQPQQLYPAAAAEENSLFYSMLANNNINNISVSALPDNQASNEEAIWDYGLWNLEDFHGMNNGFGSASSCSTTAKSTMQNLVVPFC